MLNDDKLHYSICEIEMYFEAYEFIVNKSESGIKIVNNEADTKFVVSHLKALDYIKTML